MVLQLRRFVNEARFSFNRQGSFLTPYSLGRSIPATIGLQYAKANLFPNICITGNICCDSPYAGTNTIYAQNVYQPSDVVTLIRGKHILHFGGELIMLECNCSPWGNVDAGDFNFSGQYTQASLAAIGKRRWLGRLSAGRCAELGRHQFTDLGSGRKARSCSFRMTSSFVRI